MIEDKELEKVLDKLSKSLLSVYESMYYRFIEM